MKFFFVFVACLWCIYPLFAQKAEIILPGNIEMAYIPTGEFIMGSDGPQHLENIRSAERNPMPGDYTI